MGDDDTVVAGVVAGSKFGVYDLVSLRPQSKVGDALIASGFRADMHSGRVISSSSSSTAAAPEYVVLVWAHTESKDRLVHSIPEEDLALGFVTTQGTQPTNVSQEVLALSSTCTAVKDMSVARCEKAAQRDLNDYRSSRPGGGSSAGAGGASNGAAGSTTAAAAGSTTAAGTAAAAGSTTTAAAAAAGSTAAAAGDDGGGGKKLQPGKPKTVAYVMFILCAVAAASAASANAADND